MLYLNGFLERTIVSLSRIGTCPFAFYQPLEFEPPLLW